MRIVAAAYLTTTSLFVSTAAKSGGALLHPRTFTTFVAHNHKTGVFRSQTSPVVRYMSSSLDEMAKKTLLSCPTIPMNNGVDHPAIGFGTYKVGFLPASASAAVAGSATSEQAEERSARECVADALNVGYRFLECAEFYGNEAEVGKAIVDSGVPRKELFLCSKVWTTTIEKGPDAIEAQLEQTLADLGTDYIDLYLVHWPVPGHHVTAYKTLEELQKKGKIRGIGLSNYAVEDYLELKEAGIEIAPCVNQIEINPFLNRKNTIDFFQKEGVVLQSYRSLRDGKAMQDETLVKIAHAHDKTVAQILGRWCVQMGFVYMPKSVKTARMIENAQVFDFALTQEDMSTLDALTAPAAIETFKGLYRKCVNRDTSKSGSLEGVKMDITND
uniref:NADP-dependent oxidoreductase domain-containing protein n=1 Tax=Attheya septentrionalis TaxID=420275 RepID=A0A7S2U703_9STRA|mmetsp:Transcript_11075/g.20213  ORF Transcript_11075/g.20213 Transcript_11075/m.20213 type:complete len:386 (+) Transcript_11075:186-1343(+)